MVSPLTNVGIKDLISAHIANIADDGGVYSAAWCDTVVVAVNAILLALEVKGIVAES